MKAQQGHAQEGKKMVNISVEELVKWDKRSKDMTQQLKTLQNEVARLKLDLQQKDQLLSNK